VSVLLGTSGVQAASGFTDELVPENWKSTTTPSLYGSVTFSTDFTTLNLIGASGLEAIDPLETAFYVGPASSGLPKAGTLTFSWEFNSGAASLATAAFNSTVSGNSEIFGSGGPGAVASGQYTVALQAGEGFVFQLSSHNPPADKLKATFTVSNIRFAPIPEPSVMVAGVLTLAFCGFYAWRRRRH
jgi:hypothetical protein